jgi:2-oxo-3-hexenedioate decarboxylase
MNSQELLAHYDNAQCWPKSICVTPGYDTNAAYRDALAVRDLRIARGEIPRGYKIGFTNRTIWTRYNVFGPIWGTVWNTTLTFCSGSQNLSLNAICQPRIEPEIVFGFKETPKSDATLEDIYKSLGWIAPGFEIVQSHMPDWKFEATDTIADGGLHGRLIVGEKSSVSSISKSANELHELLAEATVTLYCDKHQIEVGVGTNVLDSPLNALAHFLKEQRSCPGATDIRPGDVVTTGTWTDAYSVKSGESWSVSFTLPQASLTVHFED